VRRLASAARMRRRDKRAKGFSNLSRAIYNFTNARARKPLENWACLLMQRYSRQGGYKFSEIQPHIFSCYRVQDGHVCMYVRTYACTDCHRNLSPAAVINNAAPWPRYITHNDVITVLHFRGQCSFLSLGEPPS